MNHKDYVVRDMETRYGIPTGGSFKDREDKVNVHGTAMNSFFNLKNRQLAAGIRRHHEKCLPSHPRKPFFTNQLKEKNGRRPFYPPALQLPKDRTVFNQAEVMAFQNVVLQWQTEVVTTFDIAYFQAWTQRTAGLARAQAPELGQPGAAAASMGMCESARAPALDNLLTAQFKTFAGVSYRTNEILTATQDLPPTTEESSAAELRGREDILNSCRYEALRIEAAIIDPTAPVDVSSNRIPLLAGLTVLIQSINQQRKGYDLTITARPPPLNTQTLLLEVLHRIPTYTNAIVLENSITELGNGMHIIHPPPAFAQVNTLADIEEWKADHARWQAVMKKKEAELQDMYIARQGPTVQWHELVLKPAWKATRKLIRDKKTSVRTGGGPGIYNSGDDESDSDNDSDDDDDGNPPPPNAGSGSGGHSRQGGNGGDQGYGDGPPSGRAKGKRPDRGDGRGVGGGDGEYSGGTAFGGQYQISNRHGLSSDAAIASGKRTHTRSTSTQSRNSASSPSKLPVRTAGNGGKKTTAGPDTTSLLNLDGPSNSTDFKARSSTTSTSSKVNGKQSKGGIQSAASEPVNTKPKSMGTKQPAAASSQIVPNQGRDRVKNSSKEVRIDGSREDDYVKKVSAGGAFEGRRKA